mmetsp:Transcript_95241/g.269181  ORF Transcript_95241/g.269181 Transcript_95241/m.269181 type:complete len:455 (-) Transcript_95241:145-1509(-)
MPWLPAPLAAVAAVVAGTTPHARREGPAVALAVLASAPKVAAAHVSGGCLVFAAFVAFFCCALAVGAGVGGGALYMPMYVIATGGDAHAAVPLAKVTTNGVAWSAFIFNAWMRHPELSGPLIDYDVSLMLEPLTLAGTIFGVLLNQAASTVVVLLLLVMVLAPTAWKTILKGHQQRNADAAATAALGEERGSVQTMSSARVPQASTVVQGNGPARHIAVLSVEDSRQATFDRQNETFCNAGVVGKISVMVAIWLVHAIVLCLAGGAMAIVSGTAAQRGALVCLIVFHLAFTLLWRRRMLLESTSNVGPAGYHVDVRTTLLYPTLAFFAGVAAGGLGIAGGLIKGPMMIHWGLAPQSSTATAIFMVVFTSSSTILQYGILGRLHNARTVIGLWFVGFLGGLCGSRIVSYLMRRGGRQWQITLGLGWLIVASAVCMCLVSLLRLIGAFTDGGGAAS